jgi:hypothetical protein
MATITLSLLQKPFSRWFVVSVPARRQHYKGLRSIVGSVSRQPDGEESWKTSVSNSRICKRLTLVTGMRWKFKIQN